MKHIRIFERSADAMLCEAIAHCHAAGSAHGLGRRIELGYRRCTIVDVPDDRIPGSTEIAERFRQFFSARWAEYKSGYKHFALDNCTLLEKPQIVGYQPPDPGSPDVADSFQPHADAWEVSSATRVVSVVLFCNDVEEGGELVFPEIGLTIAPRRGTMVMFPSTFTHIHEAKPPRSGPKIAVTSWVHFGGDVKYAVMPI